MYSDDQILFVNQISILDYAQAIGLELDYRPKHVLVRGIVSLELTLDGREWYYHYSSVGGGIVQFVTWLHDLSWKNAVQRLLDYGRYGTSEQFRKPAGPIAAMPRPSPFFLALAPLVCRLALLSAALSQS